MSEREEEGLEAQNTHHTRLAIINIQGSETVIHYFVLILPHFSHLLMIAFFFTSFFHLFLTWKMCFTVYTKRSERISREICRLIIRQHARKILNPIIWNFFDNLSSFKVFFWNFFFSRQSPCDFYLIREEWRRERMKKREN